jgi:hypothetical protein
MSARPIGVNVPMTSPQATAAANQAMKFGLRSTAQKAPKGCFITAKPIEHENALAAVLARPAPYQKGSSQRYFLKVKSIRSVLVMAYTVGFGSNSGSNRLQMFFGELG